MKLAWAPVKFSAAVAGGETSARPILVAMLTTVIVDDEVRARRVLARLLGASHPEIQILGEAGDLPSAVDLIKRSKPDFVLLDVEMPNYLGTEITAFFDEIDFEIVFVTAYDDYAVKAFRLAALDYLLKPVQADDLARAIERVRHLRHASSTDERVRALREELDGIKRRIALHASSGMAFFDVDQLVLLTADGSYTHVHVREQARPIVVSKRLKHFETYLEGNAQFVRVHRSSLVNLNHVTEFDRVGSQLIFDGAPPAQVSRERRPAFERLLREKGFRV